MYLMGMKLPRMILCCALRVNNSDTTVKSRATPRRRINPDAEVPGEGGHWQGILCICTDMPRISMSRVSTLPHRSSSPVLPDHYSYAGDSDTLMARHRAKGSQAANPWSEASVIRGRYSAARSPTVRRWLSLYENTAASKSVLPYHFPCTVCFVAVRNPLATPVLLAIFVRERQRLQRLRVLASHTPHSAYFEFPRWRSS